MAKNTADYQRGYRAGRKNLEQRVESLRKELTESREERIYMQCLEMTLKHCSCWQVGGKTIEDAKGYCALAKIFADNSISKL